jgi:hypothetical protein
MRKLERVPLDPRMAESVVAFDARESCTQESRAAVAAATDILTQLVKADARRIASWRQPVNAPAYLPPSWHVGLDKDFLVGMSNSMSAVKAGLSDVLWEGPSNPAEVLCLKAILDHAILFMPDIAKVKDMDRLADDIYYLQEMGFQDIDYEFLFEPETDSSPPRRDAFKKFASY